MTVHFRWNASLHHNGLLLGRQSGRSGIVNWPPRSPDLGSLYYSIWAHMWSMVYESKMYTMDDLLQQINNAARHELNPLAIFYITKWKEPRCESRLPADILIRFFKLIKLYNVIVFLLPIKVGFQQQTPFQVKQPLNPNGFEVFYKGPVFIKRLLKSSSCNYGKKLRKFCVVKNSVFRDIRRCSLLKFDRRFTDTYILHLQDFFSDAEDGG